MITQGCDWYWCKQLILWVACMYVRNRASSPGLAQVGGNASTHSFVPLQSPLHAYIFAPGRFSAPGGFSATSWVPEAVPAECSSARKSKHKHLPTFRGTGTCNPTWWLLLPPHSCFTHALEYAVELQQHHYTPNTPAKQASKSSLPDTVPCLGHHMPLLYMYGNGLIHCPATLLLLVVAAAHWRSLLHRSGNGLQCAQAA